MAGTGTNCRGRDRQGREGRVTGCGPRLGEYGGASELIAKAVQAVALDWTQRGPATRLTKAFMDLTGATDAMDLLEGLALERYQLTAAAAPIVFQVAAEGDPVAQETICWAGRELGSLAIGVIRQLGFEPSDFEIESTNAILKAGGCPSRLRRVPDPVPVSPGPRTGDPGRGGIGTGREGPGIECEG